MPAGEVYVAPKSAYGTLVIDGSLSGLGLLKSPLRIRVKDGKAVAFEGERAEELEKMLLEAGEAGKNIAELGIGINQAARIIGVPLEDEKVAGTVHVAFGDTSIIGGDVIAGIHVDGIITTRPELFANGERIPLTQRG